MRPSGNFAYQSKWTLTYQIAHYYLGLAHEQKGDVVEAIGEFRKASLLGEEPDQLLGLAHIAALSNNRVELDRLVGELKELAKQRFVSAFRIATIYASLGDKDQAIEWLEKAYSERSPWLVYVKVEPKAYDMSRSAAEIHGSTDENGIESLKQFGLTPSPR